MRFDVIRPHFLSETWRHTSLSHNMYKMGICVVELHAPHAAQCFLSGNIQSKSRTNATFKDFLISWNWFVLNEIDSCGNLMILNAVYQIQCHRFSIFSLFILPARSDFRRCFRAKGVAFKNVEYSHESGINVRPHVIFELRSTWKWNQSKWLELLRRFALRCQFLSA